MGQPKDRKPPKGREGGIPGEDKAQAGSLSTVSGGRGEEDLEARRWSPRLTVIGSLWLEDWPFDDGEETVRLTTSLTGWGVGASVFFFLFFFS
jgi:hypothetical protein